MRPRWGRNRLRCDVGPLASERMLPLLREDGLAIPIFVCTRTVYFCGIVCHPFFVFGQREVALFALPKFARFRQANEPLSAALCIRPLSHDIALL